MSLLCVATITTTCVFTHTFTHSRTHTCRYCVYFTNIINVKVCNYEWIFVSMGGTETKKKKLNFIIYHIFWEYFDNRDNAWFFQSYNHLSTTILLKTILITKSDRLGKHTTLGNVKSTANQYEVTGKMIVV